MAGRIRDDDIAQVRERARIDEVIEDHVTLRNAGGGSRKGLCPFHDEKTPSFNVNPGRGFFHCFGCGEGGDVITFVQKIEGVSFAEAVERLAGRYGVDLHYEDDGFTGPRRDPQQRTRLVQANKAAADYYRDQLSISEALQARQFLDQRGFDRDAADHFGVGFAPRSGEALYRHLRQRGFSDTELVTAGLVGQGSRGHYDRFRGRLLWPIRELSGDVVGFGARRIFRDDRIEAKYLNTPETPLYKKSHVLYAVDLARKEIARSYQAVVVEGYTDVMACHLAGVTTAVATCGTAFGDDHARILRRLLLDNDEFRGEVIFTFDGDEAGQKAALRAFQGDQNFVGQTYVAVEPDGRDPCDLRLADGDAAVRELIARRLPLYRFVLSNIISRFDLDRADSRVDAVRESARLVASIRDRSKVDSFAREIAGLVGVEVDEVRAEVQRARGRRTTSTGGGQARRHGQTTHEPDDVPRRTAPEVPDPAERRFSIERDVLKLAVQHPKVSAEIWGELDAEDFTHPHYREIHGVIDRLGGPESAPPEAVLATVTDPGVRSLVSALSVEPLHVTGEPDAQLVQAFVVRLRELTSMRRISEVKSRLQRMNPVTQAADYNRLFGELVALESHRRGLREQVIGSGS
ncbi:MAG: DNA primase [Nocardioidaceae bacterium]